MFEAKEIKKNTVSAKGQMRADSQLQKYDKEDARLRVLFVGNSITCHGPKPQIGWNANWGMAASCKEKDYVHQTVKMLEERHQVVGFAIAQVSSWETSFDEISAEEWQSSYWEVAEFHADVVVIRLGENIPAEKLELPDIKQYIVEMIEFFGSSAKQVVITDNFWKREALDRIFEEICREKDYTFCQISDIYEDKKTMALGQFEHDGVAIHPSDYGMEMIAKRIVSSIFQF